MKKLYITETDKKRLEKLLIEANGYDVYKKENVKKLEGELERATIVEQTSIPEDVITMNTRVLLVNEESKEEELFTLVYPKEADVMENKISILAPIGTALLGYRVGDVVEWPVPDGTICFKIKAIDFQPEANGSYEL